MVLGDKLPWRAIFKLHAPHLAVVFTVSLGLHLADVKAGISIPFSPTPFSIVGVAIAILVGFRNNAAYDRWWEGRKLWGGLVNASRTLARQTLTLFSLSVAQPEQGASAADEKAMRALQREILHRHIAYLNALRHALRAQDPRAELEPLLAKDELDSLGAQKNVPAALLHRNGVAIAKARAQGLLTEERLMRIDATLTEIIGLQGGCERIKNTPIPAGYRVFTYRCVRTYCYVLPFGLVEHLGALTTVVVMAVSLVFLVLDTIGRLLEDPFTMGPNALPLSAITRTIEINLRQALGETDLPSPVQPTTVINVEVLL